MGPVPPEPLAESGEMVGEQRDEKCIGNGDNHE